MKHNLKKIETKRAALAPMGLYVYWQSDVDDLLDKTEAELKAAEDKISVQHDMLKKCFDLLMLSTENEQPEDMLAQILNFSYELAVHLPTEEAKEDG